jgi:hypothetical protein
MQPESVLHNSICMSHSPHDVVILHPKCYLLNNYSGLTAFIISYCSLRAGEIYFYIPAFSIFHRLLPLIFICLSYDPDNPAPCISLTCEEAFFIRGIIAFDPNALNISLEIYPLSPNILFNLSLMDSSILLPSSAS